MKVATKNDAWNEVDKLFPTDYEYDAVRSCRAGYSIYSSTADGVNAYICDLGDRLEVNLPDGKSINVWIRGFGENDISEALKILDDAEYRIEDNLSPNLCEASGIDTILKDINKSFRALRKLLEDNYPESKLIKLYDLEEC